MRDMHIIQEKWQEIIEVLKELFDVQEVSFNTWIKPLKVSQVVDDVVCIEVENDKYLKHMEKKYSDELEKSIEAVLGEKYIVRFVVPNEQKVEVKRDTSSRFTFDNFVVGKNNRIAYKVALAVAENPGETVSYNPLFIYGKSGLGKTHLLQAIKRKIEDDFRYKVCYISSQDFTNELIDILRNPSANHSNSTMEAFRRKYRDVDVLLIDDIQFIVGKGKTQEEFFDTFNALHMNGKQIVISSDKAPIEMTDLASRYVSRFEWGLVQRIDVPDYETRKAILEKKIEIENWKEYGITAEIIDYLAINVTSNIRELEGALHKIITHLRLENRQTPIDLEEVKKILSDVFLHDEKPVITAKDVLNIVAEHCGVTVEEMKGGKRDNKIVVPRQVAMYLLRKTTDYTLETIGMELGKRNYATVKHGIERIEELMQRDKRIEALVGVLAKKIGVE